MGRHAKRPIPARLYRSWRERVATIQRSAENLMSEMMEAEPAAAMLLSDWADNIVHQAEELADALDKMNLPPAPRAVLESE